MDSISLHEIAVACGGELLSGSPDLLLSRICTDSRHVQLGDLFVALIGEKFDAHDYLNEVAGKGAAAVVVARDRWPAVSELAALLGVVLVDDTRVALGRLGSWHRARFRLPVVAVAGSNGKTTTKELLAAVLRQKFPTLWSQASFNNDIGVPLTLLELRRDHGAAVLEVGTNHPGELLPLLRMVQPRYGILTNIGREHLEFFGDMEGVAGEEGGLAEFLPADGKLFINGDSPWTPPIVRRTTAGVVTVGLGERNDWRAKKVRVGEDGVRFEAESPLVGFTGEYHLRLLGRHQVPNALLALAVGTELGVTPDQARQGFAECRPARMRLQLYEARGARILDDSYNANADSMLAALETLHDLPCSGRRVAVLGDMAELGGHTLEAHREVGARAAALGIDHLVAVGRQAGVLAGAARAAGLNAISEAEDVAAAIRVLKSVVQPGDLVLIKASRAAGLEKVGEALR